jgi:WXXGXW repeat (2 copies)
MRWSLLLVLCCLTACATQREQRISFAEARDRPSDEACEPKGKPPTPGSVWACGYWHWDRVRYVWIEGRWQAP